MSVILALILTMLVGVSALAAEEVSADDAIQSVTAIGFVDLDGVKLGAVAVEYNADMTDADVTADAYELSGYTFTSEAAINSGDGAPGDIAAVYVNDAPETSVDGGSGTGSYVILALYTDYLYSAEQSFTSTLAVSVRQTEDITNAAEGTHPIVSVLQTRSPSVYASDWAQELVKEKHGLDGSGQSVCTLTSLAMSSSALSRTPPSTSTHRTKRSVITSPATTSWASTG